MDSSTRKSKLKNQAEYLLVIVVGLFIGLIALYDKYSESKTIADIANDSISKLQPFGMQLMRIISDSSSKSIVIKSELKTKTSTLRDIETQLRVKLLELENSDLTVDERNQKLRELKDLFTRYQEEREQAISMLSNWNLDSIKIKNNELKNEILIKEKEDSLLKLKIYNIKNCI